MICFNFLIAVLGHAGSGLTFLIVEDLRLWRRPRRLGRYLKKKLCQIRHCTVDMRKSKKKRYILNCDPTMQGPIATQRINVRENAPPTLCVACRKISARGRPVGVLASVV